MGILVLMLKKHDCPSLHSWQGSTGLTPDGLDPHQQQACIKHPLSAKPGA